MIEKNTEVGPNKSLVSVGIDNNKSLESVGTTFVASVTLLALTSLIASMMINCNKLHIEYAKQKYGKELKQLDKPTSELEDAIAEDNKLISFYWWSSNVTFGFGVITLFIICYKVK